MKDPDNHKGIGQRPVVDRIGRMEGYTQTGRELRARGAGARKMPQGFEMTFKRGEKARGDPLGRLGCQGCPNLGEVGLGEIGQAEGERPRNSFFPRFTMRFRSKSFT